MSFLQDVEFSDESYNFELDRFPDKHDTLQSDLLLYFYNSFYFFRSAFYLKINLTVAV